MPLDLKNPVTVLVELVFDLYYKPRASAWLKAVADRKQVVEIGTYRDEQMVYEHADDPCEQEDSELEAIMCKLKLLKTFIPDIEEYRPMHYTSAKTTYDEQTPRACLVPLRRA
eukprot:COSAG05_NODE_120_length_17734_cov_79.637823_2_plen_113_part_00